MFGSNTGNNLRMVKITGVFQAPCQVELENWVNSIHSACAAAFARQGNNNVYMKRPENWLMLKQKAKTLQIIVSKAFPSRTKQW